MKSLEAPKEFQQRLEEIEAWLLQQGHSLGFAESCTGGLISALVTQRPGVSRYFRGGVVSYAGAVKQDVLGVPDTLMKVVGEVSEPVARSMARGARQTLNCHWSVSVTGVAGPDGGTAEKPVGTVCFAVCGPWIERAVTKKFESKHRTQIQLDSALYALELLWAGIQS